MSTQIRRIIDGRYVSNITGAEPVMLKYWTVGRVVLRPLREITGMGEVESGRAFALPGWLFDKTYRSA